MLVLGGGDSLDIRRETAFLPSDAIDVFITSVELTNSLSNLLYTFGDAEYFNEYKKNMILFNKLLSNYLSLVRQHYGKLKKEEVDLPDEYYILHVGKDIDKQKIELAGLKAFYLGFQDSIKKYYSNLSDYLPPKPAIFTNINYATQVTTEMTLLGNFVMSIISKARDKWYSELGIPNYDRYAQISDSINLYVSHNASVLDDLSSYVLNILPKILDDNEIDYMLDMMVKLYYAYILLPLHKNTDVTKLHKEYDNLNTVLLLASRKGLGSIKEEVNPEGILLVERQSFGRDVVLNAFSKQLIMALSVMNRNPAIGDIANLDDTTVRYILSGLSNEESNRFWVNFVYYSIITPFKPTFDKKVAKVMNK